ncbi:hypothetical protein IAT38_003936 [Cryptococcus sp. DSM 104549]
MSPPQAMFVAVAPHLYRSPKVVDIGSFFLGMDQSFSELYHPNITDDLCFEKGNTKLPLLRHVVTLGIVSPEARDGKPLKTFKEHKASFRLANRAINWVLGPKSHSSTSPHTSASPLLYIMPLFTHIRLIRRTAPDFRQGSIDPNFRVALDILLPSLFCIGEQSKTVCTHDNGDWGPRLTYAQWLGGSLPASVVVHIRKGADPPGGIAWGTHSFVHYDCRRKCPAFQEASKHWLKGKRPQELTQWVTDVARTMVEGSLPWWESWNASWDAGAAPQDMKLLESTSVTVYGLEKMLWKCFSRPKTREETEELEREFLRLVGDSMKVGHWIGSSAVLSLPPVTLKLASEAEACEVCGERVKKKH